MCSKQIAIIPVLPGRIYQICLMHLSLFNSEEQRQICEAGSGSVAFKEGKRSGCWLMDKNAILHIQEERAGMKEAFFEDALV